MSHVIYHEGLFNARELMNAGLWPALKIAGF